MLTCKQFDEFMIDFLEHDLPLRQKITCWLHVRMCKDCTRFVRQYKQTIALGMNAFENADGSVPDSVPEELIKAALAHSMKAHSSND